MIIAAVTGPTPTMSTSVGDQARKRSHHLSSAGTPTARDVPEQDLRQRQSLATVREQTTQLHMKLQV
jgi:hypothetical protein